MCRNIKTLFNFEPPATELEIRDASLQFVRKLSGFNVPSKANTEAFDRAVEEVATAARALIETLVTNAEPRDREVEAARAKARWAAQSSACQRKRASKVNQSSEAAKGTIARFKAARESQGLTLAEVAARMQIDAPALSRLETGKTLNPTLATLHKWAEALGQKLDVDLSPA